MPGLFRSQLRSVAVSLALLGSLTNLKAANADCPPAGDILTFTKISATDGGLGQPIPSNSWFGSAVASLGDLNGDGIADAVLGARHDSIDGPNQGAIYVAFLNANGTVKSSQRISSASGGFFGPLSGGDEFGYSIANIGDVDGDGVTDIAVGAPFDSTFGGVRGALWILRLTPAGTVKSSLKIGDQTGGFVWPLDDGDRFGISVASVGDLDGDGTGDLAVGAAEDDDGGTDAGCLYILFLNPDETVRQATKITQGLGGFSGGVDANDVFGSSVTNLGDIDSDGVNDLAVGAYLDSELAGSQGAAWVLRMKPNGTVKEWQKISEGTGGFGGNLGLGDYFGFSVAALPDIDGDARPDLAIGSIQPLFGGTGTVWLVQLNANGSVKSTKEIPLAGSPLGGLLSPTDLFGSALGVLGDLNADGNIEIAIGADRDDDGARDAGAVWIVSVEDCVPDPVLTTQPHSVLLDVGGGIAVFTVAVSSPQVASYQWQRDGVPILNGPGYSGATTPQLIVSGGLQVVGLYRCVVTTGTTQLTSVDAVLGVRASCAGDVNQDGSVNGADLGSVLGAWGYCE